MNATQNLPETYQFNGSFNLKDKKVLIGLNVVGFVLLIFFLYAYTALAGWLRNDMDPIILSFPMTSFGSSLFLILRVLLTIAVVLIVHEAVHGFFFWFYAQQKPIFGFKSGYAYAAMPGWYFPRNQYIMIGLAPFVVINLIGILLLAVLPSAWVWLAMVTLVMNSSGAVGDLAIVVWLLRQPATAMALDKADSIELYLPPSS